jgi:hypothetical protein
MGYIMQIVGWERGEAAANPSYARVTEPSNRSTYERSLHSFVYSSMLNAWPSSDTHNHSRTANCKGKKA